MTYITTNIRLDAQSYRRLKLRAARQRTSLARLVREAVARTYGPATSSRRRRTIKEDPFFRVVGAFASGKKDGAANHDRDIYGVKA